VTFSRNANTPSVKSERLSVTACNRRREQSSAQQDATCIDSEQIDSIAIDGTRCLDDPEAARLTTTWYAGEKKMPAAVGSDPARTTGLE